MSRKFIALNEAVEFVNDLSDNEERKVVVLSPENQVEVTDEENDDENLVEQNLGMQDVVGHLEVFHPALQVDGQDKGITSKPKISKKQRKVKWRSKKEFDIQLPDNEPGTLEEQHPELCGLSPYIMFQQFFSEDVCSLIMSESERYARQKLHHDFYLSPLELNVFFGIILLSGYCSLPQERLYWCNDEDVGNDLVKRNMSRNRFHEIKRYLHLADIDKLAKNDKLAKVRPYLNLMQRNFAQFGVFSKCLSVDEQMVPCFGHFSTKMYMINKPVKFGMIIWFLASSQEYPFAFQVYTGKSDSKAGPLGERVVNELTEVLEENSNHFLHFDNILALQLFAETCLKKVFAALVLFGKIEQKVVPSLIRRP